MYKKNGNVKNGKAPGHRRLRWPGEGLASPGLGVPWPKADQKGENCLDPNAIYFLTSPAELAQFLTPEAFFL